MIRSRLTNGETENEATTGEYDSVGETQLRENEETGLYRRGNQGNAAGEQGYFAGNQRESYSVGKKEYDGKSDSEVQKRGLVRNVFHGTHFVFANHKKSYVDTIILK